MRTRLITNGDQVMIELTPSNEFEEDVLENVKKFPERMIKITGSSNRNTYRSADICMLIELEKTVDQVLKGK